MLTLEKFDADLETFKNMGGIVHEVQKELSDATPVYSTDGQYAFMNNWAFQWIISDAPILHVDVGSQTDFLLLLSNIVPVDHYDLRDPGIKARNFHIKRGDITALPLEDRSVESLSCLHVAEHIGLGRYGDALDPEGFSKACQELKRVLKPGGVLYFAVPCGKSKVVFNSHRVIAPSQVAKEFEDLTLVSSAAMDSKGNYLSPISPDVLRNESYGCGMWMFRRDDVS